MLLFLILPFIVVAVDEGRDRLIQSGELRATAPKVQLYLSGGEEASDTGHSFSSILEDGEKAGKEVENVECEEDILCRCKLSEHTCKESCWLLCNGMVIDATKYLLYHPGGEHSILRKSKNCEDCARDFNFHSKAAKKLWRSKEIGKLQPCTDSATRECCIM